MLFFAQPSCLFYHTNWVIQLITSCCRYTEFQTGIPSTIHQMKQSLQAISGSPLESASTLYLLHAFCRTAPQKAMLYVKNMIFTSACTCRLGGPYTVQGKLLSLPVPCCVEPRCQMLLYIFYMDKAAVNIQSVLILDSSGH